MLKSPEFSFAGHISPLHTSTPKTKSICKSIPQSKQVRWAMYIYVHCVCTYTDINVYVKLCWIWYQVDDVPLEDVPDVIANYDLCIVKSMKLDSSVISQANLMRLFFAVRCWPRRSPKSHHSFSFSHNISVFLEFSFTKASIFHAWPSPESSLCCWFIYLIYIFFKVCVVHNLICSYEHVARNSDVWIAQNEISAAIRQRKLGEPTGETLFGKTVSFDFFAKIQL